MGPKIRKFKLKFFYYYVIANKVKQSLDVEITPVVVRKVAALTMLSIIKPVYQTGWQSAFSKKQIGFAELKVASSSLSVRLGRLRRHRNDD